MSQLSAKPVVSLLFAILASGCASQNAINMLPKSVRLDIAREKAATAKPLRVEDMLAKARQDAPVKAQLEKPVGDSTDDPSDLPENPSSTSTKIGNDSKGENNLEGVEADEGSDQIQDMVNSTDAETSSDPVELFREAMAMQAGKPDAAVDPRDPVDAYKERAVEEEWQKMLNQSLVVDVTQKQIEDTSSETAVADNSTITASLPESDRARFEHVAVSFNETMTGFESDDNLKIRLLRHGKRYPESIVIGKIDGLDSFSAMQRALLLGQLIADASGGKPGISYDPSLSAGTAELQYSKPDSQL